MILEGLQLMDAVLYRVRPDLWERKPGWTNYPGAVWASQSKANYTWLCRQTNALCNEYTHRYSKFHSLSARASLRLEIANSVNGIVPPGELTPFYQGVPEDCKQEDPVQAYRLYYNKYKWSFAIWTNRDIPDWFNPIRELNKHE